MAGLGLLGVVEFVARLRGQVKYTGVEAPIEQMDLDVQRAKEILGVA